MADEKRDWRISGFKKKRIFKDSEGFASRLAVKTREDPENSNPKGFLKGFPKISKNFFYYI